MKAHHRNRRRTRRVVLALACLTVATSAQAVHTCTVGIGNLNFGTYTGSQITSSTTMTITCTLTGGGADKPNFTAALSTGAGSYVQRVLTNLGSPSDTLPYNLYLGTVPAILNTNVWGDGSGATVTASGSMLLNPANPTQVATFTVAGAIGPVGSLPTPGTYQDIVAGTVTYD